MPHLLRRLVPARRTALLLAALVLLAVAGRWTMAERRALRVELSATNAVDQLRLATRATLREHPGLPPELEALGIPEGEPVPSRKWTVVLSQAGPGADVTALAHKPGRPERVGLERTYTWAEWTGPDFLFTMP